MGAKEWKQFKVGRPSTRRNWIEPDCQPLTTVAHVAHVPTALRIVEDERLRAGLVFDESKLNTRRIRVVWLSPNDWDGAGGFRYGNVRFTFDWAPLVEGKKYFWVESIAYRTKACRILVTDEDHSAYLDAYDPSAGDGPWWRAPSGKHFWNGNFCLEFMFERDIDLATATQTDFVTHNPSMCSLDYGTCRYCGVKKYAGGGEFVAALASRTMRFGLPGLVRGGESGPEPSWGLEGAVRYLLQQCKKLTPKRWGPTGRADPTAPALARAVLGALGTHGIADDILPLAAQFKSADDLQVAVAEVLSAAVELPDASAWLSEPRSDDPF